MDAYTHGAQIPQGAGLTRENTPPEAPTATRTEKCDGCGREARRRAPKRGQTYRCQPCRREGAHGSTTGYRRGCRCEPCRTAGTAAARAWQVAYRETYGVLPSTAYRRANGYGPVYWVPDAVRLGVYERDGYVCQLCGEPTDPDADPNANSFPSLDHIIPKSKGGAHTADNLRTAHRVCNARRGNRD